MSGVVDFDSVPDLVTRANSLGEVRFDTVDACALTKIDSAGVAFLVWMKKHFIGPDTPLALRGAPEQLARMVAVTGLEPVFG
ncbi:MAG: STAS domain-containing protein [Gammaproteobacteria bacterium]|nr:STAS domain-containing protein [Gammaproteobacteria bacterium]